MCEGTTLSIQRDGRVLKKLEGRGNEGEIGNHSHSCEPAGRHYIGALRELWQPLQENEQKFLPIRHEFLEEIHTPTVRRNS